MNRADKVRENRLRRIAKRRGMVLTKSRRRDPLALDYQTYVLRNDRGAAHGLSLDQVEVVLNKGIPIAP